MPAAHSQRYLLPDIEAGVATVFVDRPARGLDADTILADNVDGARDGVAHLMFLRAVRGRGGARPALVAFDDFELADMLTPGITVVSQDAASMGRAAAELLFRRIGGDDGPTQRIHLRTRFIPRGSGEIRP